VNEKNVLVIMIAFISIAFILMMIVMIRWTKTRTELCERIYRRSDWFVKSKKYRYMLLGSYLLPMLTPHHYVWLRFILMSLFFLLTFPLGIKLIIGRIKVKPADSKLLPVNLEKLRDGAKGAANES
jgi:hypothetical protein